MRGSRFREKKLVSAPYGAVVAKGPKAVNFDKVPKAINFRALAQKNQLKILELKDATSICQRDMASFNSIILS
jgi:hypothetical protein